MHLVTLTNGHRAIVKDDGTRLAVPPMHPHTPRDVRIRIYARVLAGDYGLAWTLADLERDVIEGRARRADKLARVISARPHDEDLAAEAHAAGVVVPFPVAVAAHTVTAAAA